MGEGIDAKEHTAVVAERDRLRKIIESQQRDKEKLRDAKHLPLPPNERKLFERKLDHLILHEKRNIRNAFKVAEHELPPEAQEALKELAENVERSLQWIRDNGTGFIEIALCGGTLYMFSDKEAGNGR